MGRTRTRKKRTVDGWPGYVIKDKRGNDVYYVRKQYTTALASTCRPGVTRWPRPWTSSSASGGEPSGLRPRR